MDNTVKAVRKNVEGPVYRTVWADMKAGDVGQAIEIPMVGNMSVQVLGDFYSKNVVFEGSLEQVPTEFFDLWSVDGVNYNSMVVWFRPRVIEGDGDSDAIFTVIVLSRSK